MRSFLARRLRPAGVFVFTLLLIEFVDEFVFGAGEAAWPLIRDDLNLTYIEIGLLLTVPKFISSLIEPVLGILGDIWRRRVLVLGGGVFFVIALVLTALSQSFWVLMLSFVLFGPASGAFVGLAQASLMDVDPKRHEHNMARWTFAGSAGVVGGSLLLGLFVTIGLGWREIYLLGAGLALALLLAAWRIPFPNHTNGGAVDQDTNTPVSFKQGLLNALRALRRFEVLRWLTLLEFSDLMLDILYSYLALYFVDVVGVSPEVAALGVAVWTVVGLVGDLLLIPLLERVSGLRYLRVSALLELLLFPAFLLTPHLPAKLAILGALGFFNSGWYSILKAHLYSSMHGQSGTVLAVNDIFGLLGSLLPLAVGWAAHQFGLEMAMWLLLLGPALLLVGLPRRAPNSHNRLEAQ